MAVKVEKPMRVRSTLGMNLMASARRPEVNQGRLLISPLNLFQ